MTPESFNAALAQRKLEAIDILLVQARMGSNPDRIRAASAILRIAFMAEPKPEKAAPEPSADKGAPESPQQSEEIPGDPHRAPARPLRQDHTSTRLSAVSVPTHNATALATLNSS